MLDYPQLKELHKAVLEKAMLIVKERSLGEDVDRYALYTNIEIKKEFYVLKQKCQVETRRRCEAAVKSTLEEVSYNIKQGNLG